MIILKTHDGREHLIQAGDTLTIRTNQQTVAFASADGTILFPTSDDNKILVHLFSDARGSHELATLIATLAGLNFTRKDTIDNTIHRYVFKDLP